MENEVDILREVGNIASGHGSTALSELLGKQINLQFPVIDIVTPLEVPGKMRVEKVAIVVYSKILTGIEGEIAMLLDEENASKLINLAYKLKPESAIESKPGFITDIGLSLLKEVGNIVVGSYLNALSIMLKRMIVPPIPTLISGSLQEILSTFLTAYRDVEYCYMIESLFEEPESNLKGGFFLILTPYAARDIKAICHKMLKDIQEKKDQ